MTTVKANPETQIAPQNVTIRKNTSSKKPILLNFSKQILQKFNKTNAKSIHLPTTYIKDIDDVPVDLIIKFTQKDTKILLTVSINSPLITECDYDCGEYMPFGCERWNYYDKKFVLESNETKIAIAIETLLDDIEKLKFDKKLCVFKSADDFEIGEEMIDIFSSMKNVTVNVDECCVCHEKTFIKTPCNHYLCVPCADRSKTNYSDDQPSNETKTCPLCREEFNGMLPLDYGCSARCYF
jgi:hypothetical protein